MTNSGIESGTPIATQAATFRERKDLQQWLIDIPAIIEPGFTVLTSEFADWQKPQGDKQRVRFDILGIDEEGRIVVVELKRGSFPDATDMQAVKYSLSESVHGEEPGRACWKRIVIFYAPRVTRYRSKICTCGSKDALKATTTSGIPRIVIVAKGFPPVVTSSVAFLFGLGVSMKLIQFAVTRFDRMPDAYTITFETLFPPPGMESFISPPRTPTISQALDQEAVEGEARQQNIV